MTGDEGAGGEPPRGPCGRVRAARAIVGVDGLVDWWMVGWLDGWMVGAQGLELAAGLPGVLEQLTLKRLKSRAPAKGGFEVFPYWSRRIPACVAGGEVLADGHHGNEGVVF